MRLVNRAAETCNFHNRLCWCRLFDTAIAAVVLPYASKIIAIGARKAHCRYEAAFIIISEEFDERLSVTLVSRYFRCCSTDAGETYPTSFVAAGLGVETLRSKLFQTAPNPKPLTCKFLSSPFTIRARFSYCSVLIWRPYHEKGKRVPLGNLDLNPKLNSMSLQTLP